MIRGLSKRCSDLFVRLTIDCWNESLGPASSAFDLSPFWRRSVFDDLAHGFLCWFHRDFLYLSALFWDCRIIELWYHRCVGIRPFQRCISVHDPVDGYGLIVCLRRLIFHGPWSPTEGICRCSRLFCSEVSGSLYYLQQIRLRDGKLVKMVDGIWSLNPAIDTVLWKLHGQNWSKTK